ncbi:MAG: ATP-binding cassette protein, partial [Nonomuraea muscovyensis]|nr:ATP-binding cassette protein [Nonomuraea muscovyensis]
MIKDLLAYIRPHRRILVIGGLLGLIGSIAGLAMPLLAKYVVDAFGQDRSMAGPLIGLSVAVLVGAVVSAGGNYLMERTGEGIVLGARRR